MSPSRAMRSPDMRTRIRKVEVLWPGKTIEDLDGWPGTEVWLGDSWQYLGSFNTGGQFVAYLATLN